MEEMVEKKIKELRARISNKYNEIRDLENRINSLKKQNLDFTFGSVLTQTSKCPFYETEYDEYLVVYGESKNAMRQIVFINTCHWMPSFFFSSFDEAKEFINQDTENEWEVKMLKAEFAYKEMKQYV